MAPPYLQELIQYKPHGHTLKLNVPSIQYKYGSRAFSVVGPKIFNILPNWVKEAENVGLFKKYLKTFLFKVNITEIDCF